MGVHIRFKTNTNDPYLVIWKDGRRFLKRMPDVKTAEKVAAELRLRIARGEFQLPENKSKIPSLADYYETYKGVYLSTAVKASTLAPRTVITAVMPPSNRV